MTPKVMRHTPKSYSGALTVMPEHQDMDCRIRNVLYVVKQWTWENLFLARKYSQELSCDFLRPPQVMKKPPLAPHEGLP